MCWEIVLLVVVLAIVYYIYLRARDGQVMTEGYYGDSGKFCITCEGKTPNECFACFNCGGCYDRYGNFSCKGGDVHGSFNYDDCAYWKHGDPYSAMIGRAANYSCAMGPRSSNRLIGV